VSDTASHCCVLPESAVVPDGTHHAQIEYRLGHLGGPARAGELEALLGDAIEALHSSGADEEAPVPEVVVCDALSTRIEVLDEFVKHRLRTGFGADIEGLEWGVDLVLSAA
jgi:hypothetical protein